MKDLNDQESEHRSHLCFLLILFIFGCAPLIFVIVYFLVLLNN